MTLTGGGAGATVCPALWPDEPQAASDMPAAASSAPQARLLRIIDKSIAGTEKMTATAVTSMAVILTILPAPSSIASNGRQPDWFARQSPSRRGGARRAHAHHPRPKRAALELRYRARAFRCHGRAVRGAEESRAQRQRDRGEPLSGAAL